MNDEKDLNCHCDTTQGGFYRRQGIFCVIPSFALLHDTRLSEKSSSSRMLAKKEEEYLKLALKQYSYCEFETRLLLCCSESCFSA